MKVHFAFDRSAIPPGLMIGIGTIAIFYFYSSLYISCLSSDAAMFVRLAHHLARTRSWIAFDWYYPNSDIVLIGPHLIGFLTNSLFGFGPNSARACAIVNLVIVAFTFYACVRPIGLGGFSALVGTVVAISPWSNNHVEFLLLQPGYAYLCAIVFASVSNYVSLRLEGRSRLFGNFGPLLAFVLPYIAFISNPLRGIIYLATPVLFLEMALTLRNGWRNLRSVTVLFVAGSSFGSVCYYILVSLGIRFSIPAGARGVLFDSRQISQNIATLSALPASYLSGFSPNVFGCFGAVLIAAGIAFAMFESRKHNRLLFFVILSLTSLIPAIAVAGVLGNVFRDNGCIRYFMPALVPLTCVCVAILVQSRANCLAKLLLWGFGVALAASCLCLPNIVNIDRETGKPANFETLVQVAKELQRRGIQIAFAEWEAGVLNLVANGSFETCFVNIRQSILHFKWNEPDLCQDIAKFGDRFAVVARRDQPRLPFESLLESSTGTFSAMPIETFAVGKRDVVVFRTADVLLPWLAYPLPDGKEMKLPYEDFALNPMMYSRGVLRNMRRGTFEFRGESGETVYGPYISLVPGRYVFTLYGRATSTTSNEFFLAVNAGQSFRRIAQRHISISGQDEKERAFASIEFVIRRETSAVHFLLEQLGVGSLVFTRYKLSMM